MSRNGGSRVLGWNRWERWKQWQGTEGKIVHLSARRG